MARADVRVRVRPSVVRVHVSETAVRTVVRIPADQNKPSPPSTYRSSVRLRVLYCILKWFRVYSKELCYVIFYRGPLLRLKATITGTQNADLCSGHKLFSTDFLSYTIKGKARADVRVRVRPSVVRGHESETAVRTAGRRPADQNKLS